MPLTEGLVLDIGGGSAQISQVEKRRFKRGQAVPLVESAFKRRAIIDSIAPPGDLTEHPKEEDDDE